MTESRDTDPITDTSPAEAYAGTLIPLFLIAFTVYLFGQFVVRPVWWLIFGH